MATTTAERPITAAGAVSPKVKTRTVTVEVHTAESLADLLGLDAGYIANQWWTFGAVPHATRIGDEYLVLSNDADRLRAIRSGVSPERVYRREYEAETRARVETMRPINEAIARADAQCARDLAARQAAQHKISEAYLARERAGMQTVDTPIDKSAPRFNAVGARVV